MKNMCHVILVLAGILAGGCATRTSGTSVTLNHDSGESVVFEGSMRLSEAVSVTGVTYDKVPSGLNRVNVQLTSLVDHQLRLQYRIAWYNAEGMEIDGESRPYRPLILQGRDAVTVTGVANSPAAVKSRLRLREFSSARVR